MLLKREKPESIKHAKPHEDAHCATILLEDARTWPIAQRIKNENYNRGPSPFPCIHVGGCFACLFLDFQTPPKHNWPMRSRYQSPCFNSHGLSWGEGGGGGNTPFIFGVKKWFKALSSLGRLAQIWPRFNVILI